MKREPLSVGYFAQGSQPVRLYLDCFTNIPSFRLIVTLNLTLGMCRLVAVFRYSQTSSSTSTSSQPYLTYPSESQDSEILAASLSRQSSSGSYDQNSRSAIDTPSNFSEEDEDSDSDASSPVDMG